MVSRAQYAESTMWYVTRYREIRSSKPYEQRVNMNVHSKTKVRRSKRRIRIARWLADGAHYIIKKELAFISGIFEDSFARSSKRPSRTPSNFDMKVAALPFPGSTLTESFRFEAWCLAARAIESKTYKLEILLEDGSDLWVR